MCKLVLDRGSVAEFTSVSNIFRQSPRVPHPDEYAPPVYAHQLRKDPRGQAEARPARAGHGRHRAVHAGLRERCLIF